jgi:VWFA-related protein
LQNCAAVVAFCVILTSPAAGPAANADGALEELVSVGYVYVPVVVRSPKGYVRDLEPGDFRLLVDGRPVVFDSFETGATAPTSVVVMQDLSGSMANGGKLEASRGAVRYLLDQARPDDEFALAWFAGGAFEIDVPFTTDLAALREALDSWEASGTTALQDAVAWLPQIAAGRSEVKRAALLITDGVDNASALDPGRARQVVREAELPVFVLGLGSGRVPTADESEHARPLAEMLDQLATATGGRYFALDGPDELAQACAETLADLRHQYVLGFSVGEAGRSRDHRLEVQIRHKGQRALAYRRNYHGLDPAAVSPLTGER